MTPIWKQQITPLLAPNLPEGKRQLRDLLARVRVFDMRSVQEVTRTTFQELLASAERLERPETGEFENYLLYRVDLGERVCMPADEFWLEWSGSALLLSNRHALCGEPTGQWFALSFMHEEFREKPGDERGQPLGAIRMDDGIAEAFTAFQNPVVNAEEYRWDEHNEALFIALASIALISSPGARREAVPAHRGTERDLKRFSPSASPEVRHARVVLGRAGESGAGEGVSAHHPKAYHFCRAHTRQRANGRIERVRAHCRGDPAFGFRLPSYQVKAPTCAGSEMMQ